MVIQSYFMLYHLVFFFHCFGQLYNFSVHICKGCALQKFELKLECIHKTCSQSLNSYQTKRQNLAPKNCQGMARLKWAKEKRNGPGASLVWGCGKPTSPGCRGGPGCHDGKGCGPPPPLVGAGEGLGNGLAAHPLIGRRGGPGPSIIARRCGSGPPLVGRRRRPRLPCGAALNGFRIGEAGFPFSEQHG